MTRSLVLLLILAVGAEVAVAGPREACYARAFAQFGDTTAASGGYYERAIVSPGTLGLRTETARRRAQAGADGAIEIVDPVTGVVELREWMGAEGVAYAFPDPARPGAFLPPEDIRVERCEGPDARGVFLVADVGTSPEAGGLELRRHLVAGPDTIVIHALQRPRGSAAPFVWSFTEVLTLPR
jgi:hypothetical protein